MSERAEMVEVMLDLSRKAGVEIMRHYAAPEETVREKADSSPVTDADLAADKLISAGLRAAFPDVALVTEEQAASHTVVAERFFLVDPLDGTKEFVKRRGEFTVNIALIEKGQPTLGVVYAPAKGRIFWAKPEGGAAQAGEDGAATDMRVSSPNPEALRVVASKSHRDAATDAYIEKYAVADLVSAGSSLKFCLVAAGEADLYPRLGRTMEWDTGAGHAVLAAAGGKVVRFDDHSPLGYGKSGFENPFFIAHAPGITLFGQS